MRRVLLTTQIKVRPQVLIFHSLVREMALEYQCSTVHGECRMYLMLRLQLVALNKASPAELSIKRFSS